MFGKKKEISPAEMQELNDKAFETIKDRFRRRIREIAAAGCPYADYKVCDYYRGEDIQPWFESLGFTVKKIGPIYRQVSWPNEEVLSSLKVIQQTKPIPRKFTWGVKLEREELGTWTKHTNQWDYVCSACGKHAEYVSDYCPNCGKKMKPLEGRKYD